MGAGAFSKQIENPRTPFDWLSTDPAVVDAYIEDEMCGAMFSAGGYATLTDLTGEVASPSCAAKVPKDLPVLFVSAPRTRWELAARASRPPPTSSGMPA